ncbi:MAG: ACT domain-containing protein [Sedimentisphaerales bacterium]|nr:ACT domain-containing protein [Sedimentisphaerales bacterium]MBN2842101.1 ACT domain-containing protein [Sedimentisphaerales bacterium]
MKIMKQLSVFLINKPGILAQVLNELADGKVNIVAMTMMDSVEHGVLRIVPASPDHARSIIEKLNLQVNETEVLCVTMPNSPGAMADVATKLSEHHINITYCYVTSGARGGKTNGIFKVADLKKAIKVMDGTDAALKKNAQKKEVRKTRIVRK